MSTSNKDGRTWGEEHFGSGREVQVGGASQRDCDELVSLGGKVCSTGSVLNVNQLLQRDAVLVKRDTDCIVGCGLKIVVWIICRQRRRDGAPDRRCALRNIKRVAARRCCKWERLRQQQKAIMHEFACVCVCEA